MVTITFFWLAAAWRNVTVVPDALLSYNWVKMFKNILYSSK